MSRPANVRLSCSPVDAFDTGPADLVIVLPVTSTIRQIPLHVLVQPPEGGLKVESRILTDGVRSISKERLKERWGAVSPETMTASEQRVRTLLGL